MNNYPFTFDPKQPFVQQASDWIADVFYEKLPEAGLELRDEQIYMAFQLERAYNEKQTIFAGNWSGNWENDGLSALCDLLCAVHAEAGCYSLCG